MLQNLIHFSGRLLDVSRISIDFIIEDAYFACRLHKLMMNAQPNNFGREINMYKRHACKSQSLTFQSTTGLVIKFI